MATPLDTVYVQVEARLAQLEQGLNKAVADAKKSGGSAGAGFSEGFQQGTRGVGDTLNKLGQIAIGGTVVNSFRQMANEANQAQIAVSLFQRQLERNGESAQAGLAGLDKIATRLGALPQQLADNATQLLRQGLTFEQVGTIFERAAASGLAAGKTTQEAINAVTQAVVNQQSIYLNYAGISQNLDQAYKEFAKSVDKSVDSLTQQEKAQAALNLIVRATNEEYADLDKLLGGLTGTNNNLNRSLAELRNSLGTAVIPVVNSTVKGFTELVNSVNVLPGPIKNTGAVLTLLGGAALATAGSVGLMIPAFRNFIGILPPAIAQSTALAAALRGVSAAFFGIPGAVAVAIGALGAWATAYAKTTLTIQAESSKASGDLNQNIGDRIRTLRTSQNEIDQLTAKRLALTQADDWGKATEAGKKLESQFNALGDSIRQLQAQQAKDQTAQATRKYNEQFSTIEKLNAALRKAQQGTDPKAIKAAQDALDNYIGSNKDLKDILDAVEKAQGNAASTAKKSAKEATAAIKEWANALKAEQFDRFREGLTKLSLAQLEAAKAGAFARRDAEKYGAVIQELQSREQAFQAVLDSKALERRREAIQSLTDAQLKQREAIARTTKDAELLNLVFGEQARRVDSAKQKQQEYLDKINAGRNALNQYVISVNSAAKAAAELRARQAEELKQFGALANLDQQQKERVQAEEARLKRQEEYNRLLQESIDLANRLKPPPFEFNVEDTLNNQRRALELGITSQRNFEDALRDTIAALEQDYADAEDKASDAALKLQIRIAELKKELEDLQNKNVSINLTVLPNLPDLGGIFEALRGATEQQVQAIAAILAKSADFSSLTTDALQAFIKEVEKIPGAKDLYAAAVTELVRRNAELGASITAIRDEITKLGGGVENTATVFSAFSTTEIEGFSAAVSDLSNILSQGLEGTADFQQRVALLLDQVSIALDSATDPEQIQRLENLLKILQGFQEIGAGEIQDRVNRIGRGLEDGLASILKGDKSRFGENLVKPDIGAFQTALASAAVTFGQDLALAITKFGSEGLSALNQPLQTLINSISGAAASAFLGNQSSGLLGVLGGAAGASINPIFGLLALGLPLLGDLFNRLFAPSPATPATTDTSKRTPVSSLTFNYITNVEFSVNGNLNDPKTQTQITGLFQTMINQAISQYDQRVVKPALEKAGVI